MSLTLCDTDIPSKCLMLGEFSAFPNPPFEPEYG